MEAASEGEFIGTKLSPPALSPLRDTHTHIFTLHTFHTITPSTLTVKSPCTPAALVMDLAA